MKKFTYIIATLCVVAIGTAIFIGCEKEDVAKNELDREITYHKTIPSESELLEIDLISADIANFHDICVSNYTNEFGLDNPLNEDMYENIISYIITELINYPTLYDTTIEDPNSQHILDYNTYIEYLNNFSLTNCLNNIKSNAGDSCPNDIYDAELIGQKCEYIENHIQNLIINSNSYEEFKDTYDQMVNSIIPLNNINNYAFVRIFADIFASSCMTWGNYYYQEPIVLFHQKETSWWEKAKATASNAWNAVKPVAKADANGAITATASVIVYVSVSTAATGGTAAPITGTALAATAAAGAVSSSIGHVLNH